MPWTRNIRELCPSPLAWQVIVAGPAATGKTCLIERFAGFPVGLAAVNLLAGCCKGMADLVCSTSVDWGQSLPLLRSWCLHIDEASFPAMLYDHDKTEKCSWPTGVALNGQHCQHVCCKAKRHASLCCGTVAGREGHQRSQCVVETSCSESCPKCELDCCCNCRPGLGSSSSR